MEFETLEQIEKIASKLKIKNRQRRLEAARELNEMAKLLIDWKKTTDEESNTIHKSLLKRAS